MDSAVILSRVGPKGSERPAVLEDGKAYDVSDIVGDLGEDFWVDSGTERIHRALQSRRRDLPEIDLDTVRIGSAVPKPSKIICIGLNYLAHIEESGADIPEEPVLFFKAPNTVVGAYDDVIIPPQSAKTDYEIELAVIVGKECRYLPNVDAAVDAIGGYAVSNDLSEREYQLERGGQWVKGKSCETFNPLGPYLVTADQISNPDALNLELRVNGELRQSSTTADMLFSIGHLVWYISQFMVLEPGDIINTGTPSGVALGLNPPRYLRAGDVVEATITGLGTQKFRCSDQSPQVGTA